MKSEVKFSPAVFAAAGLAFVTVSCHQPAPAPPAWAFAGRVETNGIQATFCLSATNLTPGARLDCELDTQSPALTRWQTPPLNLAGMEPVDFSALPVNLNANGNECRQFRWTFQAGPPRDLTPPAVQLDFVSARQTNSLKIALPVLVIQSAFAPGTFTNALPPLEETNAF